MLGLDVDGLQTFLGHIKTGKPIKNKENTFCPNSKSFNFPMDFTNSHNTWLNLQFLQIKSFVSEAELTEPSPSIIKQGEKNFQLGQLGKKE